MKNLLFFLVLFQGFLASATLNAQEVWKSKMQDPAAWTAAPDFVNKDAVASDYDCKRGLGKGLIFRVGGSLKAMKWVFNSQQELESGKYIVVRYRAGGLYPNCEDFFLYMGGTSDAELLSLPMKELQDDGEWHVVAFPLTISAKTTLIALQVFTGNGVEEGTVEVDYIAMADKLPEEEKKK